MKTTLQIAATLLTLALTSLAPAQTTPSTTPANLPKSHAETTNYIETSRYADVLAFFTELQKITPLLRIESFGTTVEKRDMPLIILSDPPISTPREARSLGKPVIFIMANIHAGEVEGKEAVQILSRRIVAGDLRPLLDKLIILIAPIYNADGNERISMENRTAQNGPIAGVGIRENAQGFDLNRDYIKLESPEATALVNLFNTWDPLLTADLHTTDGSYIGYHLTYSIPLNPMTESRIADFHRAQMMPAISAAMLNNHKFRGYYYGNFTQTYSSAPPGRGTPPAATTGRATTAPAVATRPARESAWYAFSPQPRVGQNYLGLRNRFTILSEAYSYLDFKSRVDVTEAFVEEIFKFSAAHGDEMRKLAQQADQDAIKRGRAPASSPPLQLCVEYTPKALPDPVEILVGEYTRIPNPRSGHQMTAASDKFTPTKMLDYGLFAPTRSIPAARAYLFADEPGTKILIQKLRAHGIAVETLTAPLTADAESFTIATLKHSNAAFQTHREVKLTGAYNKEHTEFPAGTLLVRTAQPLGLLASYLLEPESEDSLTTWNFLDPYLAEGKTHPIHRLALDPTATTRLLDK